MKNIFHQIIGLSSLCTKFIGNSVCFSVCHRWTHMVLGSYFPGEATCLICLFHFAFCNHQCFQHPPNNKPTFCWSLSRLTSHKFCHSAFNVHWKNGHLEYLFDFTLSQTCQTTKNNAYSWQLGGEFWFVGAWLKQSQLDHQGASFW